jgi:hypothetical protein
LQSALELLSEIARSLQNHFQKSLLADIPDNYYPGCNLVEHLQIGRSYRLMRKSKPEWTTDNSVFFFS